MESVQLRAAFERFPSSVKGAFLLRGADGLPHQVRIEGAHATECAGRGRRPVPITPMVLEVAPTMDTFVPFELPLVDLSPGWYQIECDVVIDAQPSVEPAGDRFMVPWPRASLRRGTVPVRKAAGDVKLDTIECTSDSVRIGFECERLPAVKLTVDGDAHAVLEVEHDAESGKGRIIAYPVLRSQDRLAIEVNRQTPVEVRLP